MNTLKFAAALLPTASAALGRIIALPNFLKKSLLPTALLGALSLAPHAQACLWTIYQETESTYMGSLDPCSTTISALKAPYVSNYSGDYIAIDESQADSLGVRTTTVPSGTNFWIRVVACPSANASTCGNLTYPHDGETVLYASLTQLCMNSSVVTTLGAQAACQTGASPPPQGRLTLSSNTPVMTSDMVNAGSVYYTPYVGNQIPIYDACCSAFSNYTFSQLTMTLNSSNQTSTNIYDLYVFVDTTNSGSVTIGAGPAWYSSASRCMTSCSTDVTQLTDMTYSSGFWVNANTITLTNDATTYYVPASAATYVGSVYMTASGATSVQFEPAAAAGGSGTVVGLWNAYNRVRVTSSSSDSTSTWTYSGAWRDANNSASNSIKWLDGLGQTSISAAYDALGNNSSASGSTNIGVGINAIATPAIYSQVTNTTALFTMHGATMSPPILGLNITNAIERATAGTETFYGGNLLTLKTEY